MPVQPGIWERAGWEKEAGGGGTKKLSLCLGIVIHVGVCSAPAMKGYRSHESITAIHPICDSISRAWFEEVKRYCHAAALDAPTHTATGAASGAQKWIH